MKRKLLVLFAALFAVLMCVSVSAMTLDTAELAEETTETVEAKIVPGINVVNGQEAFENFDAEGQTVPASLTFGSFDAASMAISTDKAKSGTQSLTGKGNGTYPKINFNDIVCEEGRQYFIHINAAVDVDTIPEYCLWVMQDGKIVKDITSPYKTNAPKGEWGEIAVTVTSTGTVPLYIQTKGNGGIFYYDDLAVIPYYKISYIGLDGETVAATEYVLFDANGDIIKHYIPDLSKVEGATG